MFTELSAPSLTEDGTRVALLAEVTGDQPVWYFGDLQPDGFFDLKVAASAGMPVNGSDKVLDLYWLDDPNGFTDLLPNDLFQIHLDAISGKLAFIGYLSDADKVGQQFSADKEQALFIADDSGITLVVKAGVSDFTYNWEGETLPFYIGFKEIMFINDRLLLSTSAIGEILYEPQFGLFIYENGSLDPLLITTQYSFQTITDAVLGEVNIERVGNIALNENGIAVAVLHGILVNEIDGIWEADLVRARFDPTGANRTQLDPVVSTLQPADGFPNAIYAGIQEISLNRYDDLAFIAPVYQLDEQNKPIFTSEFEKGLYWMSLDFPAQGTVVTTGTQAKGYTGAGSAEINDILNLQIAGEYISCVVTYPGDDVNYFGNSGILRTRLDMVEPEDLVFFVGGPSNVSGVGTIDSLGHILMGTDGDIVCQVSWDDGFERAVIAANTPDLSGIVEYRLLASSRRNSYFICENSCPGFTPFLSTIGFIPRGSTPTANNSLGGETGFGQWANFMQAGWVLFTYPDEPTQMEYSILFDLGSPADYSDAPETQLAPAPIAVPHGYAVATHLIDNSEFLGLKIDEGIDRLNSDPFFQYFGIDDDTEADPDDEDGVAFITQTETIDLPAPAVNFSVDVPQLIAGETVDVEIHASTGDRNAYINAWIDFNRDGIFQVLEQFISSALVPANTDDKLYTFQIKYDTFFPIQAGYTFARFRLSSDPDCPPAGIEDSGEVEDYLVRIILVDTADTDYGDAPQPYPTLLADDGARHAALPNSPLLGETVDFEFDGIPSADADGDDLSDTDDEDGVTLPLTFPAGSVQITATATMAGKLDAWIDFNQDGDWDDIGEQVLFSTDVMVGENVLQVTVPQDVVAGTSYARFRISQSGGLTPSGQAQGGEVEDYKVTLGDITTWAGYPIAEDGESVFTGSFLDWINITHRPYVYIHGLKKYVYLPEDYVGPAGAWLWINRFEIADGSLPAWAGYSIRSDGKTVFTNDFLDWVNIEGDPYIFVFNIGQFIYLPEDLVTQSGSWAWVWR